jgi:hypothetical protein
VISTYRKAPLLRGVKKSKKVVAVPGRGVNLISFWGEQKPVAAFVATGFIFYRELCFSTFQASLGAGSMAP